MKIALCFFGYFGKQNINTKKKISQLNGYNLDDYNELWSIEYFKKNVIKDNDVDIFFHCWNEDLKTQNLLIQEYKPKKYLYEKQDINYNKEIHINKRLYSENKSINLMNEYAKDNNIKYDFVFLTIFDQIFFTKINFNDLDNNYIYNSNWNDYGLKNNIHVENKKGLYEQWYITNMDYIQILTDNKKILEMYNLYPNSKFGSHIQRYKLLEKNKLLNKIKYILYIGFDHIKMNQVFLSQYKFTLNKLIKQT